MGKVAKGVTCSVNECNEQAVRSLSIDKVRSSGLDVRDDKRVYLCDDHYKQWKKMNKQGKGDDLKLRYG
jgi:hypothetical protein